MNRAVTNLFADQVIPRIRVVRAVFAEGRRVWEGPALRDKAHVQLAVRDVALVGALTLIEAPENEAF